jgi:hypothetical protein
MAVCLASSGLGTTPGDTSSEPRSDLFMRNRAPFP